MMNPQHRHVSHDTLCLHFVKIPLYVWTSLPFLLYKFDNNNNHISFQKAIYNVWKKQKLTKEKNQFLLKVNSVKQKAWNEEVHSHKKLETTKNNLRWTKTDFFKSHLFMIPQPASSPRLKYIQYECDKIIRKEWRQLKKNQTINCLQIPFSCSNFFWFLHHGMGFFPSIFSVWFHFIYNSIEFYPPFFTRFSSCFSSHFGLDISRQFLQYYTPSNFHASHLCETRRPIQLRCA